MSIVSGENRHEAALWGPAYPMAILPTATPATLEISYIAVSSDTWATCNFRGLGSGAGYHLLDSEG